jgi:phenylacetate-CoA ligase
MLGHDVCAHARGYVWRPAVEEMSRENLAALQLRKLQRQVRRAQNGSEFYAEKFMARGLGAWQPMSLEELDRLPVTTHADLVRTVETTGDPTGGRLLVDVEELESILVPASPNLDAPPVFGLLNSNDRAEQVESLVRFFCMLGLRNGDIVQVLAWGHEPMVALYAGGLGGTGVYAAASVADYLGVHVVGMEIVAGEAWRTVATARLLHPKGVIANLEHLRAMEELLSKQGQTPSSLGYKFIVIRERSLAEALKLADLQRAWEAPIFFMLDCAESGFTAMGCGVGRGLHFWEDLFYVECTDEAGRRCDPASGGYLTATSLTPGAAPLLRFQTEVRAKLDFDACACGRSHARIRWEAD